MKIFKKPEYILHAPCDGKVLELKAVPDPAFASEAIGMGFAIEPSSDEIYAPINGKVTDIFPTCHAFGFHLGKFDVLLHIGINTVTLKGRHFDLISKHKGKVSTDHLLCKCDFKKIRSEKLSTVSPVVFTRDTVDEEIYTVKMLVPPGKTVKKGTPVVELIKK